MFNKTITVLFAMMFSVSAYSSTSVPVMGSVDSKCVVTQDVVGVFGNPSPGVLSTDPTSGGVDPVIRFDVLQAETYQARIAHPDSFSESPGLSDVVYWTGSTSVDQVTDANMSAYDAAKVEYNNVTEFNLTIAGSTWFKVESQATYGVGRAFPGGNYQAAVTAECIAI